jgi:hypothetical protein
VISDQLSSRLAFINFLSSNGKFGQTNARFNEVAHLIILHVKQSSIMKQYNADIKQIYTMIVLLLNNLNFFLGMLLESRTRDRIC